MSNYGPTTLSTERPNHGDENRNCYWIVLIIAEVTAPLVSPPWMLPPVFFSSQKRASLGGGRLPVRAVDVQYFRWLPFFVVSKSQIILFEIQKSQIFWVRLLPCRLRGVSPRLGAAVRQPGASRSHSQPSCSPRMNSVIGTLEALCRGCAIFSFDPLADLNSYTISGFPMFECLFCLFPPFAAWFLCLAKLFSDSLFSVFFPKNQLQYFCCEEVLLPNFMWLPYSFCPSAIPAGVHILDPNWLGWRRFGFLVSPALRGKGDSRCCLKRFTLLSNTRPKHNKFVSPFPKKHWKVSLNTTPKNRKCVFLKKESMLNAIF